MPQAKSQEPRRHSLQGQKRIITAHITVIMSWRAFFTVVVLVVVLWRPHLAPNAAYEQFARSQSENASTFRNAKRSICWNLSSNDHPPPPHDMPTLVCCPRVGSVPHYEIMHRYFLCSTGRRKKAMLLPWITPVPPPTLKFAHSRLLSISEIGISYHIYVYVDAFHG